MVIRASGNLTCKILSTLRTLASRCSYAGFISRLICRNVISQDGGREGVGGQKHAAGLLVHLSGSRRLGLPPSRSMITGREAWGQAMEMTVDRAAQTWATGRHGLVFLLPEAPSLDLDSSYPDTPDLEFCSSPPSQASSSHFMSLTQMGNGVHSEELL